MKKSRILFAGFLVSILISAFALTKNENISAKAFAAEPGFECIKPFDVGGDYTDHKCPKCSGTQENVNPSKYDECGVAPAPILN